LGCLLYYLCFINHPFEDSAKLRILNAKYTIPANNTKYTVLHDLIRTLLQIDPRQRPTIKTLVENIEDLAIGNDIGLNEPLLFLFNANENMTSTNTTASAAAAAGGGGNPPPGKTTLSYLFNNKQTLYRKTSGIY
jgi:cyclin G-associated kinase